ncbi:ESAT-6 protein secretion system EspG family protein [Herbihabitans rhizosphaerae]|uniref:ESAT-6 protein secretion system EspG family protein n=1 Tax=Herbihabitans rhizosphaerae TaxID=1872711 RepID=A0A4Q7L4V9_9PSEU|nr:ESX secretion-associated protein EspG [Herbihabitans rhizosphaerae]RZS44246.1 ESAT-6 protein secretion system EspG family protein [Herbihabitans rhizosphaerae]
MTLASDTVSDGAERRRRDPWDTATRFGLVEFDLLATFAGVEAPFPLRVPSFGRIDEEREVLFGAASHTLAARGLAEESGPLDIAAELVDALRHRTGTVDMVLIGTGMPVGVVAMVAGPTAVLCRQALDDDPSGFVDVRTVRSTAVAAELAGMLPKLAGASTMPIRLPTASVVAGGKALTRAGKPPSDDSLRRVLATSGIEQVELESLVTAVPSLAGRGQAGATRRSAPGADRRVGRELSWLDGPKGRVRVDNQDSWVSVNPLRPDEVRATFDEFSLLARSPERG